MNSPDAWVKDLINPSGDARTLVFASNNPGKLQELRTLFDAADLDVSVLGLSDLPRNPVPRETGATFEENALIKARGAVQAHRLPALADDSGLEVSALNGMPGVRSARWAGTPGDDEANLALLLRQIEDVTEDQRQARFVCALALVMPHGDEHVLRANWEGSLSLEPLGSNGFGYDPIFVPCGTLRTSAQLDPAEKNEQSHRGKAFRQIIPIVAAAFGVEQG